ncbi:unnamed protein product [Acidithrix sp. C25]|nr:unnamed protein product [Acidithrix sp. C25]
MHSVKELSGEFKRKRSRIDHATKVNQIKYTHYSLTKQAQL